jgi:hypothetical protein
MRRPEMNDVREVRQAVSDLLGDFAGQLLSPCTSLALGSLAVVAGLGSDPSIGKARQRAGERRDAVLERAFEMAMIG